MGEIVIIGLGPGDPRDLTRAAWEAIAGAERLYLRTAHHPVVAALPPEVEIEAFDALYETKASFAEVYEAIVARILELGEREAQVLYAVPGHPWVGEATVPPIVRGARERGLTVRLIGGLSFVEPTLAALEVDALDGLQIADALEIAALHHPPFNPDLPALIAQVYSRAVASDLKLTLMNQYPDEHRVALVGAAGTQAEQVRWMPLYAIDREEVDHLTSLYLPPLPPVSSFEGFQETVAHLRAPDGCPWDRKQTHRSLRKNLLEESYEVLAAIDADDIEGLREELGDLLLQIVLHTQIAIDEGEFRMGDLIAGIDAKIKRRHPHVWGTTEVEDAEQVTHNWEAIKRAERAAKGKARASALDGIPAAMPALAQADAYLSRVQHLGFRWPEYGDVVAKVREELEEVAAAQADDERQAEVGDLLLAMVNLARSLGVEPESALREANRRFARRFHHLEEAARRRGVAVDALSIEEMLRLWDEAKAQESE
jgi:tetrapyrrole methylase family protein/MazG family protein